MASGCERTDLAPPLLSKRAKAVDEEEGRGIGGRRRGAKLLWIRREVVGQKSLQGPGKNASDMVLLRWTYLCGCMLSCSTFSAS